VITRTSQALWIGFLSGVAFLGIGGRLAMRALALAVDRPTNFGLAATLGIIFIGAVLGLAGGLVFALVARGLPGKPAVKGPVFGTLFLAGLIPLQPPAVQEEIAAFHGHLLLATVCFGLIFCGYGLTLASLSARWEACRAAR
jgi:hypothetical protein